MATISGVQYAWQVDLIVNENTISNSDISSNTSSANWELWIRRTDTGNYQMYGTPTINITIAGKSAYSGSKYFTIDSITATGVMLLNGTVYDLEHNNDGTIKDNTASFTWTGSGFSPDNVSGKGTFSTTTIPRKTEAPDITAYVEDYGSLTLQPKSSSFSHKVKLTFEGIDFYVTQSGTLTTNTDASTIRILSTATFPIKFEIPYIFYMLFTGKEATGEIEVTTYRSNTILFSSVIGTDTSTITIKCPDKCKPTLSTKNIIDINQTSVDVSGDNTYLISGKSTAQVTVTVNASGGTSDNATTITSVTINGKSANDLTAEFANITSNMFEITMTNSRGFTNTEYFSNGGKFIDYFDPTFIGTVSRVEPTTGEAKIVFNGKYYKNIINIPNSSNNSLALTYAYRKKGASEWTTPDNPTITDWTNTDTGYEGTFLFPELFDYKSQFEIIVYYIDAFGTRSTVLGLTRGLPVYWWSSDSFNVVENTNQLYSNGNDLRALPEGEDNRSYWNQLPNGLYWYGNTGAVPNMPTQRGFVWKFGFCSAGDFSVLYFEQASGGIYRKSGNASMVSDWIKII